MSRVPLGVITKNVNCQSDTKQSMMYLYQPHDIIQTDAEYSEMWNLKEHVRNLENAIERTEIMNRTLEGELNRLENVEEKLKLQTEENQRLYEKYLDLKKQLNI